MAPTFVDLFCGIGGFRIGLEASGFECVYANDIDAAAVETYKSNRSPDADYPVECADIRDVFQNRLSNIPRHHVLAAGFPCQPFGLQGKMPGEKCEKNGDLGGYVVKIAAAKRPVVVLLENVDMFFNRDRPWYKHLDEAFREAGYVCCHSIFWAWEFGLPQHRRRGIIVAVREDVQAPFKFPPMPVRKRVTIREFLLPVDCADLKYFTRLKEEEGIVKWNNAKSPGAAWEDIVDDVPESWRTRTGILHLGAIITDTGASGRLYHDLGHHSCITAAYYGGSWMLTPGPDDEGLIARKLHIRELCRIQGFPDSFELKPTSKSRKMKQLGNSVPPPMVEWVGRAVAEQYRSAFNDDDDDSDGGDDNCNNENLKENKTAKTGKPRRKSRRKSRHKSKHHARRHSKRHSKHRSRVSSGSKSKNKLSEGHESSSTSNSKRKLSSGFDTAPPPKRQRAASLDGDTGFPVRMAGFDVNVEEWFRK